jgi:hypothetical protein
MRTNLPCRSLCDVCACCTNPCGPAALAPVDVLAIRLTVIAISHELAGLMGLRLAGSQIAAVAVALSCGSAHQNQRNAWVSSSSVIPFSPRSLQEGRRNLVPSSASCPSPCRADTASSSRAVW